MPFQFDPLVRRDFSGCDILWFSATVDFQVGTFVTGDRTVSSSGTWLDKGRWLSSAPKMSDVVSCTWAKSIGGSPTGVCSIQLKKQRQDWAALVQPGDAMVIFMSSTLSTLSQKTSLVSVVFVDRVDEGVFADQTGATLAVVTVSARDIGKIFEEYSTVFDPNLAYHENIFYTQKFKEALTTKKTLSPVEMILFFLDVLFNTASTGAQAVAYQWRFPGNETVPIVSLLDVSTFVQVPLYGYCPSDTLDFAGAGSAWALFAAFSNDCVNELFFDVRDIDYPALDSQVYQETEMTPFVSPSDILGQLAARAALRDAFLKLGKGVTSDTIDVRDTDLKLPKPTVKAATLAMVFRQRPYDTGAFLRLPASSVVETELIQTQFGRAYHNVSNFFHMDLSGYPEVSQESLYGIAVNPTSLARFGLRRRDLQSRYFFQNSDASFAWDHGAAPDVDPSPSFRYYVPLVATWNAYNERFIEGNIVLHFRPDIRVGTRLEIHYPADASRKERLLLFYVQGVRHNFAYDQGRSQTILTVVRGYDQIEAQAVPATCEQANLYWSVDGWRFLTNPYDVFVDGAFKGGDDGVTGAKVATLPLQPGTQPPAPPSGSPPASAQGKFVAGTVPVTLTGYYPFDPTLTLAEKKVEGGIHNPRGLLLITLQQHLADPVKYPYCSVAGDGARWQYGQRLIISSLSPTAVFRVVDTGGNFFGPGKVIRNVGREPLDICVQLRSNSIGPIPSTVVLVEGDVWK